MPTVGTGICGRAMPGEGRARHAAVEARRDLPQPLVHRKTRVFRATYSGRRTSSETTPSVRVRPVPEHPQLTGTYLNLRAGRARRACAARSAGSTAIRSPGASRASGRLLSAHFSLTSGRATRESSVARPCFKSEHRPWRIGNAVIDDLLRSGAHRNRSEGAVGHRPLSGTVAIRARIGSTTATRCGAHQAGILPKRRSSPLSFTHGCALSQ